MCMCGVCDWPLFACLIGSGGMPAHLLVLFRQHSGTGFARALHIIASLLEAIILHLALPQKQMQGSGCNPASGFAA